MKNKFKVYIFFLIIVILKSYPLFAATEQFNFNVTEIEITNNGNYILGKNRGKVNSIDGIVIDANTFIYDKLKNILQASGNVVINDTKKDYKIYAEKIIYFKNEERVTTIGNTKALIQSKYEFNSKNVILHRNINQLISNDETVIYDSNNQFYKLQRFKYQINDEILNGEKVLIITNYNLPKSDTFYFSNGIFNLKEKNFIAKDTEIKVHKDIFDNTENDPRLYGVSSIGKDDLTIVNKGVFTSCKKTDKPSPWCIKSKKITHDKKEKMLIYENAFLNIYDIPVFYFPKFFHPDPSVIRKSGFLRPQINNSDNLGSSINIPYYHVVSDNKDYTIKPSLFDDNKYTLQNEYRLRNKNSSLDLDFSLTKNYKSPLQNKKNSLTHFFSDFKWDLNWKNFDQSFFNSKIELVNNDTYLKLFDSVLSDTPLKPKNFDNLETNFILTTSVNNKDFETGINIFENLQNSNSDRYQYIFPYYNFYTSYFPKQIDKVYFNFSSNGTNNLTNTNNLKSKVINNLNFKSFNQITNHGFVNNFGFYLKNLNVLAKNDTQYKSSPQLKMMNILEFNSKLPMTKNNSLSTNTLTPKFSLRYNPNDMNNFSTTERNLDINNIFQINRLGLDEMFEPGGSLTVGIDFKKQYKIHDQKFYQFNLATVIRDKANNNIPNTTTLNKSISNLFGSFEFNAPWNIVYVKEKDLFTKDYFNLKYNFALDNDFSTFEKNSINLGFDINNFVTNFIFNEENGQMGNENTLENTTAFQFNDNNYLKFNTRRNRKINLTEYYDLVYEYKNDCLTAGIKYKKTYYQDREIKPREDLMLTITLIPLTIFEQEIDQSFYRN